MRVSLCLPENSISLHQVKIEAYAPVHAGDGNHRFTMLSVSIFVRAGWARAGAAVGLAVGQPLARPACAGEGRVRARYAVRL